MSDAPQAAPWGGGDADALRDDVTATLKEMLKKRAKTPIDSWTEATPLKETGISSFDIIECILDLEDRYGVSLDFNANDASNELETVGDFINSVVEGVAAGKKS